MGGGPGTGPVGKHMPESAILARLREGPATVAYLGTSVTVQRSGYRPRTHDALQTETGHDPRATAAGVGAADSLAGLFLADVLVLPHKPDVCFIEFATIDAMTPTEQSELDLAIDALMHKLLAAGCRPCLLQPPLSGELAPLAEATGRRAIEVSQRFGIPLVRLDHHLESVMKAVANSATFLPRDGLLLGAAGAAAAAA